MGPGGIWLRPPRWEVDADLGREFFDVALSCPWGGSSPGSPFPLASPSSVLLTGLPARPPWPAPAINRVSAAAKGPTLA